MGRSSTKKNKNIYHTTRESLNLSRAQASELLEVIAEDRIEKIENEKIVAHPEDILTMAKGYKAPHLCNHYCSQECPIGMEYVPKVKIKELSQIVLEMVASLNTMNKDKDRLIEIAADGRIDNEEIDDFIYIQDELERISITVETLQLWAEKMVANGLIDKQLYLSRKKNK